MKKSLYAAVAIALVFAACKSKSGVAKTDSTAPTDAQLTALKTKVPSGTMDDLKKGHAVYYSACTKCHGAKDVSGYSEPDLKKVVDGMSEKASLNAADKEAVWRYALAVNLASKK